MSVHLSRSRRDVVSLLGFAALVVLAAVPFGEVYAAHLTRFAMMSADVSVERATLEGDRFRLDLAIPNAGRRAAHLYVGMLRAYTPPANILTDVTSTESEDVTIRPGETATATIRMGIQDGAREELRAALEAGELVVTGFLGFQVADASVRKRLTLEGIRDE